MVKIGSIVKIKSLNREGIVLEVLSDKSIKVSLGNLPITIKAEDFEFVSQISETKRKTKVSVVATSEKESENLDLHGATVEQALRGIEDKINKALIHSVHRIKVIHGIGSFKVRNAIHAYLSESRHIHTFKVDEFNPGVTWVYL